MAKGLLDGRVRYGKSAAGVDALQNLAEARRRVMVAIASWSDNKRGLGTDVWSSGFSRQGVVIERWLEI